MTLPDRAQWHHLSPLLDELLSMEAPARVARLAELQAQDVAVASALREMLDNADRAAAEDFLGGRAEGDQPAPPGLLGKQVGAYVIEAHLGDGGSGSVWRAHRADGRFEGAVAIKLLHLSLLGRDGALRFEREGAILARLTHPNVARLLDAGVTADGQPYLVLEMVEGTRIDRHCDAMKLNVEQRLALFDDVLAAVAHAHSHLVIHRDIKPTNIFVGADGGVKLLDFGVAKLLLGDADATLNTVDGRRALTPGYAAPEQLQGGAVTTATDIYALGVLLYMLLAGRHPTAAATSNPAEMMRATLDTEPLPFATALTRNVPEDQAPHSAEQVAAQRHTTLPRLRRQLRGDLDNIVARTLRKDPAERYQTVAALAEDLHRHRDHEPVHARPDSLAYRSAKFVRRNRSMVAAGLALMLAVALGLVGTATQAVRAKDERDSALRALAYAQASSEFIDFLLQEGSDKPISTADLLARAEPVLAQQFADDPAQRAHLQLILANLFAQAAYPQKALALLIRARQDATAIPDTALQAEIDCHLANLHGIHGTFELAPPLFDTAIGKLRTARPADPILLALCLQLRAEVAKVRGRGAAALADARAALTLLGTPRSGQRSQAVVARATLAGALGSLGQEAEAAQELQRAISELDSMGRGQTRHALGLYNNLGVSLSRSGQTLSAVNAYGRALAIARGFGAVAPALQANYANRLIELGRSDEAMPLIEHAVSEAQARGDRRTGPIVLAQGARAWCYTQQLARCAQLLSFARAELTALLPASHSVFGTLATTEAQHAWARGDLPAARADLKRALAIFDAASDRNHISIRALTLLARAEQLLGEHDAAQAHAQAAVLRARAAMAGFTHSEWLGSALVAQGLVQQARGDTNAAQASWRAAVAELQASLGDAAPATIEARRLLAGA